MSAPFELDAHRFPAALLQAIGFCRVESVDREARRIVVVYEAAPRFAHSGGSVVQGGIAAAWIDNAMAIAFAATPEGGSVATLELKLSWLAPLRTGEHRVEARVLKRGLTVAFLEAQILTADGEPLVRASSTGRVLGSARLLADAKGEG